MPWKELRRAYAETTYMVLPEGGPPIPVRVGARQPQLERLLEAAGAATAAFITAWNPRSRPTAAALNRAADHALAGEIDAAGLPRLRYEGRGDDPAWLEPGWMIPGLDRQPGLRLALRYRQNAILFYRRGRPAELAFTPLAGRR